ncbi:hypothetical protein MHUMG1_10354 [Metarhizium humberi]|uniref:Branched-chain-amino-acid aminotransferase n=1 Tax=Metarhizium humberi TaxID=2596975 RepID=A0A9P8M2Z1_9HYPO|nr:hypothetical protein MHUMG1_10354 [Metarhizium humberi]
MVPFPPPPLANANSWPSGFDFSEVNGHVESKYSKETGQWTPLRFVASPYMNIHGMAPALNYGQQAAEGLKAFRGPGDSVVSIFRPDRNALRMQHSADVASMPRVPVDMFLQACRSVVALNAAFVPPHESGAALYLRPQLYGSSPHLSLSAPNEYTFCVFAVPTGIAHGADPVKALIIDEFDRTAPNGAGHAKLGGNYAPVLRWSDEAKCKGYGITLHLDSARHEEVDEFSTCAFIGITATDGGDGVAITVPESRCIIESITSESILQIARSYGWKTIKRPIKYTELPDFTEVIAAGTAASLVPVRSITRQNRSVTLPAKPNVRVDAEGKTVTYIPDSRNEAGPICLKLLTALREIQLGKVKDEFGWRCLVTEDDMQIDGGAVDNGN